MCECFKNAKIVKNGQGISYYLFWCDCVKAWVTFKVYQG